MRYVIYTRVSGDKQTVENQLHEAREYVYKVKQKGDEVLEFSEPDSSTRRPMEKRPKLMEMFNRLREGDQLVVYKFDRLARDKQELMNIFCDIRKKGVDIYGLRDPILNEEMICIYAFIACTERENIRTRTLSGLRRKRDNMEKVGSVLYGYKLDETQIQTERKDCHSSGKPYKLIPDENERKQVNLIAQWHSEGHSYGDIARMLNEQGFANRKGNPIHKMSVYRILQRIKKSDPALTALLA